MMKQFARFALAMICLLPLGLIAETEKKIYMTKDANGNTVFSDQAPEDAKEIVVPPPQTFQAPVSRNYNSPSSREQVADPGTTYASLSITHPEHDSAVRNNAGNLSVNIEVKPGIQSNHSLILLVDGEVKAKQETSAAVTLENLDRGTHQFKAQIVHDETGEVLIESETVSSTMLRHFVKPKRRAN